MARSKGITDLETINQKLKAAGVRLRVVIRNHKLYLRGTLPPRPNLGETKPKQTYLALSLDATAYGYKMAFSEALKIWAAIDQNKFDWSDYTATVNWQSCASWIERYKKHWFQSKGDTERNRIYWEREEWLLGLKCLPQDADLTAELLEEVAQTKPPNTRSRQRLVQILARLAKFADIPVDLSPYQGNYSASKVQSRNIPSDEEISNARALIANPAWQLVFSRMAIYGLRDHEAWHCQIDSSPPHACQVLLGKTGPRSGVMPLYPEWATAWKPWEGILPVVNCKGDYTIYGERTARAFKRLKVPFAPYNLRHAYAIRASVIFKFPIAISAQMMGHSPTIHLKTYNRWITNQQTLNIYKEIMANNPPLAPVSLDQLPQDSIDVNGS